jgi:SAM-dependent methyltransferase
MKGTPVREGAPLEEPCASSGGSALAPDGDRFGFSRFASYPLFTEVNRWLVERVASLGSRIVDLACGPGAITELILAAMRGPGPDLVYAVDPSLSELDRARHRITSSIVRFIHGSAENLSRLVPQVDVVVFCNAIHLVTDKRRVLEEIRKVLGPGGALAFNTTYFTGCYVPGTERFWRYWVLRAAQYLRGRGITLQRGNRAPAMQWFTPEEYGALVAGSGFPDASWHVQEVGLSAESLENIGQFSLFIQGALPGVPLEAGAEALRLTVRPAMRDARLRDVVPRYWLQFIARTSA